jgi:hypothetical protein
MREYIHCPLTFYTTTHTKLSLPEPPNRDEDKEKLTTGGKPDLFREPCH